MSMIRSAKLALIALSVLAFQSVSHAETPAGKQEGHSVLTGVNTTNVSKQKIDPEFLKVTPNTYLLYRPQTEAPKLPKSPRVDARELDCLARNIYHESKGEPEEGKVAVGLVTLNRADDPRFPSTVCGVVNQRTTTKSRTICQFSWRCSSVRSPSKSDSAWLESLRIARTLLTEPNIYQRLKRKYDDALYFHAAYVRPSWARQKINIARIGAHIFYGER